MSQPNHSNLPGPVASYYRSQDIKQGSWWKRCYTRQVEFRADDFEEFITYFQQLADELIDWQKKYKTKAKILEIAIDAHPWIAKRIMQRFRADFGTGHGYGDFCRYGTVKLHLFNALEPKGEHYLIIHKGQKVEPA
ncbi:hypothetical protein ACF3NA_05730 [Alkanindiges sp. WGS2144]|uniref:hypothetical protein n=1 Tax=Alkanindiges sp. WGS2144 TaxID=3366808 RepID=UPI003752855B